MYQSEEQKQRWEEMVKRRKWLRECENSIPLFLADGQRVRYGPGCRVKSADLYRQYCLYCEERGYPAKSLREVCTYLTKNKERYEVRSSTNIPAGKGKRLRGFLGIGLCLPEGDADLEEEK